MSERVQVSVITSAMTIDSNLQKTLVSIYRQKSINLESILIFPNQMASSIKEQLPHSRVENQDGNGVYNAMNTGLKIANGEFCLFLNSGDEFLNDFSLHDLFEVVQDSIWGYGSIKRVFPLSNRTDEYSFRHYNFLLHQYGIKHVPHPASLVKTSMLLDLGGFDETFQIAADQKLLLSVASLSKPVICRQCIVMFRLDGISASRDFSEIAKDFKKIQNEILSTSKSRRIVRVFSWEVLEILNRFRFLFGKSRYR